MPQLTVRELIEKLKDIPPDTKICIAYDGGYTYTDAQSIEHDLDFDNGTVFISSVDEENSDEEKK